MLERLLKAGDQAVVVVHLSVCLADDRSYDVVSLDDRNGSRTAVRLSW